MNLRRWWTGSVCAIAGCLLANLAAAQTKASGFALNRFEPSERGSEWFAADSLDFRSHQRPAVGAVFDYARKPLVLYELNGDRANAPVKDQLNAHLGGSVVLSERVRLALSIPVLLRQTGTDETSGNVLVQADDAPRAGDLRVALDVRLLGAYRSPFSAAIGGQVWLPTGSQSGYSGDGSARLSPRVLIAGEASAFVYSLALGYTYRANDQSFLDARRGSEFTAAAALGVRVFDGRMVIGPELFGSSLASDVTFDRRSPLEAIFGTHVRAGSGLRIGAGAGPGLSRGLGTPAWRGLLSVEWIQPIAPAPIPREVNDDSDGDGVSNRADACADEPGVVTDDPKTNGCPVADADGDGITDSQDACPDRAGIASADPLFNGCPDADEDGIFDTADACPKVAGEKTGDPATNGCPKPKDRDGDGIDDGADACPAVAGPSNEDPKKHGCPAARLESGQIRIREQLQFAYNSAKILPTSDSVLNAVVEILKRNSELRISVEGHTDDRGTAAFNKRLSEQRARAAVAWLVEHGIEKSRLSARGFGEEQPLTSNESAEAREANRRVEFHVIEARSEPRP